MKLLMRKASEEVIISSIEQLTPLLDTYEIHDIFLTYVDDFVNKKLAGELLTHGNINELDASDTLGHGNRYLYDHNLIHCSTADEYQFMSELITDAIDDGKEYKYTVSNSEFVRYMIDLSQSAEYDEWEIDSNINDLLRNNLSNKEEELPIINTYAELNDKNDTVNDKYKANCWRHDNDDEIPVLYINGNILYGTPGDIHDSLLEEYGIGKQYDNNIVDLSDYKYTKLDWYDLDNLRIPTARGILFNNVIILLAVYGGYNAKTIAQMISKLVPDKKVYYHLPVSYHLMRLAKKSFTNHVFDIDLNN